MSKGYIKDIFGNKVKHEKPLLILPRDKKLNMVWDMDGTATRMVSAICRELGIDEKKWNSYNLDDSMLTQQERSTIWQAFHSYEMFKAIEFRENIHRLEEIVSDRNRVRSLFHTLSYSEDAIKAKEEIIEDKLSFFRPDEIFLELGMHKTIVRNVDIAVDDSPRALELSDASLLKIMMRQSNNEEWFNKVGMYIGVIPCEEIDEAVDLIKDCVEKYNE